MNIYLKENGEWKFFENISIDELRKIEIYINEKAVIGAGARIGKGAEIGAWATIEIGARIEAEAEIGAGAFILCVRYKYPCNKYTDIKTNKTYIRIGCEIHPDYEWTDKLQEELAIKHDFVWWHREGKKIFEFLKSL